MKGFKLKEVIIAINIAIIHIKALKRVEKDRAINVSRALLLKSIGVL
jgi:hypothetical protein